MKQCGKGNTLGFHIFTWNNHSGSLCTRSGSLFLHCALIVDVYGVGNLGEKNLSKFHVGSCVRLKNYCVELEGYNFFCITNKKL